MNDHLGDEGFAEKVVIDGHLCKDARELLGAVEEFACYGELEAVYELLRFAGPRLSADGLANVAGELALRLRKAAEAAL